MMHIPVMLEEAIAGLAIGECGTYWDGTFGRGGHSRAILSRLGLDGRLIGSDRDAAAQAAASAIEDARFVFIRGAIEAVLGQIPEGLAGFLWDLGLSTPQLEDAQRGFSFQKDGPLDMRMDQSQTTSAYELVNQTPEKELADLIYQFGEERFSRRIASRIVEERSRQPIADTQTLADICRRCYPRRHHRIHPATRTFQALRIAVNDELGQLARTLPLALQKLAAGGRGVVISFHSLEDRIVKHCFRDLAKTGAFALCTKKPLSPTEEEQSRNPASRSAKLRIIERAQGAAS